MICKCQKYFISVDFQIFLQKRRKFQVRQCFCSFIMLFYHHGGNIFKYYFRELSVPNITGGRSPPHLVSGGVRMEDKSRQSKQKRNQITAIHCIGGIVCNAMYDLLFWYWATSNKLLDMFLEFKPKLCNINLIFLKGVIKKLLLKTCVCLYVFVFKVWGEAVVLTIWYYILKIYFLLLP